MVWSGEDTGTILMDDVPCSGAKPSEKAHMSKWGSIAVGAVSGAVVFGLTGYALGFLLGRISGYPAEAEAHRVAITVLGVLGALTGAVEGGTTAGCAHQRARRLICLQGSAIGALMGAAVAGMGSVASLMERGRDPGVMGEFLLITLMGAFAGALIGGPAAVYYGRRRNVLP